MKNKVIRIRANPEVVMYIDTCKIYIHCPYAHYNECPAFEYVPQLPLHLDAVKLRNGPIITPQKTLTLQEKHLVASEFQRICKQCYKKLMKEMQQKEQTK